MKAARLALAALAAITATAALAAPNWLTTVDTRGGGHAIGNPGAKVKLAELVSYTCPTCGEYQVEAGSALELYVMSGKVQLDVRHMVRDDVDLTAAILANCGPATKFYKNHKALMLAQPQWLARAKAATDSQTARWKNGPDAARYRAIASDLKFYELMGTLGYERVALDRCLSDAALAKRIDDQSNADSAKWSVRSTPSFVLNGSMLNSLEWRFLRELIDFGLKG